MGQRGLIPVFGFFAVFYFWDCWVHVELQARQRLQRPDRIQRVLSPHYVAAEQRQLLQAAAAVAEDTCCCSCF